MCQDFIGVGSEGWVPSDQFEEMKVREQALKKAALEADESEDQIAMVEENWLLMTFVRMATREQLHCIIDLFSSSH